MRLVTAPLNMVTRAATSAAAPARSLIPANAVDDWGRDEAMVRAVGLLSQLRWDVTVGGADRLPARGGALLITNSRQFSFSAIYTALALGEATGRPVRFVGRPDIAPIGPFMRRIGGLLARPDELEGALRHDELVVMSAQATRHPRHAGKVDATLIAAATATRTPVFPVASISSPLARSARVEVAARVRPKRVRRGPLGDLELAESVQHHVQKLLNELGGMRTGVAAIDYLGEM
jgi:1-acyl-sn-glycerol-3-phosphate acyltransferase